MSEGASSGNNGKTRRFAAFISYAHADAAIAAKLQSRLERYRLPKNIAESHAEGRAALGQIFRDREDLAAAPSLSDAIRAAIGEAEALVVICSPDAQASRWVGEEIALFRRLHPDRPILAALVSGEPDAAFPAALTESGTEPLAADLRKGHDGEQLGFLKIVAGIAGVPLDALIQRDAQRRVRRVMWITGGALTAMLAMGIMTTLALQARNEAARQRASAEGLVEYMITDLRTRLKGVNRLDIMDGVNRRAMEHYRRQGDLSKLPDESLERRARTLHAMGEDDEKRGDLKAALAKFREAHRVTAALLAKKAHDPARIFAHAQSEYWVGYAAMQRDDLPTARQAYLNYAAYGLRLSKIDPSRPEYLMEAGYGFQNLGSLDIMQRRVNATTSAKFIEAAHYFSKALALRSKNSQFQIDLSEAYAWLADSYAIQKQFHKAQDARERQRAILKKLLASDTRNSDFRQRVLLSEVSSAQLQMDLGEVREAALTLKALYLRAERASAEDRKNGQLQKHARAVGLLYVRAALGAGNVGPDSEFSEYTKLCKMDQRSDDEMLMCDVLHARISLARGDLVTARVARARASKLLKQIESRGSKLRWGIDFHHELKVLEI